MTEIPEQLEAALAHQYRIESELGRGASATVYLARDTKHDRPVAVKVLAPAGGGLVDQERFTREIQVAAQLSHPHILALHDSGETAGLRYYVMPFVGGDSLRDRLVRDERLSVEESVSLISEVARALDYAHRAGIVHRDIKPENILLHEGHALVADFGIAQPITPDQGDGLTQTGMVVGTPAYMSPEQISGDEIDGRSDLYSLGCVLFECLTGKAPFAGGPSIAHRFVVPTPTVRATRQEVTEDLDRAIGMLLAVDPASRFQTGEALAAALAPSRGASSTAMSRTIVVLPFSNQSPDPDNEYFSDGLTEEIIADLSKVGALSVISRTSAMQLKGTEMSMREIGRELGVGYALDGSVRKAGNNLRITAQLIEVQADTQIWAEKYSGTVEDVFEVQERVSREIVAALDDPAYHAGLEQFDRDYEALTGPKWQEQYRQGRGLPPAPMKRR